MIHIEELNKVLNLELSEDERMDYLLRSFMLRKEHYNYKYTNKDNLYEFTNKGKEMINGLSKAIDEALNSKDIDIIDDLLLNFIYDIDDDQDIISGIKPVSWIEVNKDDEKLLKMIDISNQRGSAVGKYIIAICYGAGLLVKADEKKCRKLMSELVFEGDIPKAKFILGRTYFKDFCDPDGDLKLAFKYTKSSYEEGYIRAAPILGEMYEYGYGTIIDPYQALSCYEVGYRFYNSFDPDAADSCKSSYSELQDKMQNGNFNFNGLGRAMDIWGNSVCHTVREARKIGRFIKNKVKDHFIKK